MLAASDLDGPVPGRSIRGSSGLFGFMPITEQAGVADELIRRQRPREMVAAEVERLIALMRRVTRTKMGAPSRD